MIADIYINKYGDIDITGVVGSQNDIRLNQIQYDKHDRLTQSSLFISYSDIPNIIKELKFVYESWRGSSCD